MQIDSEELKGYIMYKTVQFFIFDDQTNKNLRSGTWAKSLAYPLFFEKLKVYIKYMTDNNYLEDEFKQNVFNILDILKKDHSEEVRELIRMINGSTGEDCYRYYAYEISKRVPITSLGKRINTTYEGLKSSTIISIRNDYIILNAVLNLDDETFIKEFIPVYSLDTSYFYSMRALLTEYEDLMLLKVMVDKLKIVLDYNKKNINKEKLSSSMKRKIKSEMKVFEKCL